VVSNFQGTKDEGQFISPDWIIYQAVYGAMLLVDEAIENLDRLTNDFEVPFRPKADMDAKAVQS
jgi:hypothetical protein